jgi:hypothetical protein
MSQIVDVPTDFNSASATGLVKASKRFIKTAFYDLEPGAIVRLVDADGNRCFGRIEEVQGLSLKIRPAWETWEGGSPRVEVTYAFELATPHVTPEKAGRALSLTA